MIGLLLPLLRAVFIFVVFAFADLLFDELLFADLFGDFLPLVSDVAFAYALPGAADLKPTVPVFAVFPAVDPVARVPGAAKPDVPFLNSTVLFLVAGGCGLPAHGFTSEPVATVLFPVGRGATIGFGLVSTADYTGSASALV